MPPQPRQQQAPAPPGMPPEAQRFLSDLGIDLSAPSGGAAGPISPPVYFGTAPRKPVYRKKMIDGVYEPVSAGRSTGGGDQVKSLDEANDAFYGLGPGELVEFQQRIVSAGIVEADQIVEGDYDDLSFKVWSNLNSRAASFYKVGQKRTPAEVLDMIAAANRNAGLTPEAQTGQGAVTSITPGATLEQQVQQAARQRLGRKLRSSEVQKFVTLFQGMERTANQSNVDARQAAEGGADMEVLDRPSMNASAADFVEDNFATEAASQDTYGYYTALQQMIGGV
jgi:hypothetical protein